MTYIYCALISVGVFLIMFTALAFTLRWAVPRYGAIAMRAAMSSAMPRPPASTTATIPPPGASRG